MKFPNLFSPAKINNLVIQNRIIMAPGMCGGELMRHAGTGIVMVRGDLSVPEKERDVFKESHVELRQALNYAHESGAAASFHIHHFGLHGANALGPSSCIRETDGVQVRAMNEDDMADCIRKYTEFALKAKKFGFDMIDLHLGHGWLGGQFLSPYFNKRTDKYGGSLENRARFPLRLIKSVREALGDNYPIGMRWSATDCLEGGLNFEDSLAFVKMAEPYLNAVEISCGTDFEPEAHVHCQSIFLKERMPNVKYARIVKKECPSLVVAVVGAINRPKDAEEIIANGWADLISMSRSFLADPEWAIKAREGRDDDIIPCLRCRYCDSDQNRGCTVNPRYSFLNVKGPHDYPIYPIPKIEKSKNQKRVVVIGAGPGGISAAVTARKRGHEVLVFEKNGYLGGALQDISKSEYKYEIGLYLNYLKRQLDQCGAMVKLNVTASPEMIKKLSPDAIVLSSGAKPIKPPIKGIDLPNVMDCYKALENSDSWGKRVVIIGGGTNGVEFALEQSCKKNREAVVIEATDTLATNATRDFRIFSRQLLQSTTLVKTLLETRCTEITPDGVSVINKAGATNFIPADSVIYCVGLHSPGPNELLPWYGIAPQTFLVGDCRAPSIIKDAVSDGYGVGLNI